MVEVSAGMVHEQETNSLFARCHRGASSEGTVNGGCSRDTAA